MSLIQDQRMKYLKFIRPLFIKSECEICGETKELELHHKEQFSSLLQETLSELNLEYNEDITIYTKEQLEIIKQVLLKHNLDPKGYPVYQHIDELIQNTNQMLNVLRKGAAVLKDHTEEVEDICPNYFSYL